MLTDNLIAIDVHTHAEVSCRQPVDEVWKEYEDAASQYFKASKRPTISEAIDYYRELKIGLVMFTVNSEFELGNRRIPNEEIADAARDNSDIMIAFASIDPHTGKLGLRKARALLDDGVNKGSELHPKLQAFLNNRNAHPAYKLVNEYKLPAIFHSDHCGIGTGLSGGGLKLKYSNPIHIADVAAEFADMTVIIAHPSWP